MAISKDYLDFILDQLSTWDNVYYKKMFGGAALYQGELAFAMIAFDEVFLKVDESNIDKYIKLGSTPLQPFKNNETVLSFYKVPADIVENSDEFIKWSKESLQIQIKRNNRKHI